MKRDEIIFLTLLVGGMLIPPLVFGLWWMFATVLTFYLCFGLFEFLSVKTSGNTISQKFWAFRKDHPVKGWILIVGWGVAWVALLWHFVAGG